MAKGERDLVKGKVPEEEIQKSQTFNQLSEVLSHQGF